MPDWIVRIGEIAVGVVGAALGIIVLVVAAIVVIGAFVAMVKYG